MSWENYFTPRSLDEAISLLTYYHGAARVVAGGTDLMPQLQKKNQLLKALIDISKLDKLREIREEEGWLRIGAMCTHSQIAASPLIRSKLPALAAAAESVGSPQIRNVGTIGGNVVNAQPAADTAIALLALDARAALASGTNRSSRPVAELFAGVGKSLVDATREILTEFIIPISSGQSVSSFKRLARRKALSLPTLNTAVSVELTPDLSTFQTVRIAVGPVATVPWRAMDAEALMTGAPVNEAVIKEASQKAAAGAAPRNSLRGGADYRKEMVKVLVERAVRDAVTSLGGVING